MLASTVQFSTYDQTPATRPHQTSDPHGDHSGMRCRPALQDNDHPKPSSRGPLSQDPTACLRTGPSPPPAFHAPGGAVLAGGKTMPAELVSVPPSSTVPDTPRPPGSEEPSGAGRGSGPPHGCGGHCSLERGGSSRPFRDGHPV